MERHVFVNDDIVVAGNGMLAVACNGQRACAKKHHLALAKQRALLVVGLLGIGGAVSQLVGGAAVDIEIEQLAALVVDGRTVGMMDADTIQLYAVFLLSIHQQRTIGGGTAEHEQQRIVGSAAIHRHVGSVSGHVTIGVASHRDTRTAIDNIDDSGGCC